MHLINTKSTMYKMLLDPSQPSTKLLLDVYYRLKPIMPRWFQIYLRRMIVQSVRPFCSEIWPIDRSQVGRPERWSGWPGGKEFAIVLTHDIETAVGQSRCRQLLKIDRNYGFRSSFNFVANEYEVSHELHRYIRKCGFEIGVHGLYHDEKLFKSKSIFREQAKQINKYLQEWDSVGFRSPCMYRNLDWICELNIDYDSSTFDTDPFEPQPDGVRSVFPFLVRCEGNHKGFVELPYTLSQDFTLFVIMKEKTSKIWKQKLKWIVEQGGMALLVTHPDYMSFNGDKSSVTEYPVRYYEEFLQYIRSEYDGRYWNPLAREISRFWAQEYNRKTE